MPSPRSQRLPPRRKWEGPQAFAAPVLLAALLAAILSACGSAPPPPAQEPAVRRASPEPLDLVPADRSYVVDPLTGYVPPVEPGRRERIASAWRAFLEESDVAGAGETADTQLAEDPGFHPAQVLAAQVDFAAGDDRSVVDRLLPVSDALPGYTASQLLLGRAAERLGDVPLAYAAYRAAAARNPLALKRTGELHSRALEIVSNRLHEALRQGEVVRAEEQLSLLRQWAPSETLTLEGVRSVAVARQDLDAELAATTELSARNPDDQELLERRAELELAVGDPGEGLQIVQELAARHKGDLRWAERVEAAKFRWRLTQLPRSVQEVAAKTALTKADFALLLYWLVPDVRNSRPTAGRIATDVLDHPHREEIVRVANLGLMEIDPTLHRFFPGTLERRSAALRTLFRMLSLFDKKTSCPGDTCEAAARCGLLFADEECRPSEALSGSEGVELIRRSLKLLGGA
jgi:tetratricopeptide (TPR) repeat protein